MISMSVASQLNLMYDRMGNDDMILRWKLYLQVKNFSSEHVAGKDIDQSVPDALS